MTIAPPSPITAPSTAFKEMHDFCRVHKDATKMLMVATNDYAAARCLSQNLLITALIMGAQAVEKYLKAYLLMMDPNRKVRKMSHCLPDLLREVDGLTPQLLILRFMPLIMRFHGHYLTRYPDNPGASTNMTTADMIELDELILLINENLPCPKTVRYRTGLYPVVTFSLDHGTISPTEHWIKLNNRALMPMLSRIVEDQRAVLKELHPQISL